MIKRTIGFVFRVFLGIVTFVGSIFVIFYAILWDFLREKVFAKKPIEKDCFDKILSKEDISKSKKE
ncbi:hypothetical protein [Aquimarina muelleri]|uniref:Uncharacterized protein n=1 Tax=Aquimarina muelleri TaxID=279356 RepID=A0A918JST3_9FLAO|nr:hypothetical protein [Aquimarina muelleri]MCX2762069.1 hypothetical protein [Aquimarina muelleri]GGX04212.1 hypothetical protein GCM10007384_02510 [Aquimarina muelleri]